MDRQSSHIQTNRSPLNNSRFKQLYSFPKSQRFVQRAFVSKAPYYDNKVTSLNKRATSFGYGNKMTLENKERVPPPNNYQKTGIFEDSVVKRRGYSFSHDEKKGPVDEAEVLKTPGPGKYHYRPDKMDFQRVSYSFRGKYEDPLERGKNVRIILSQPLGPGQYPTISDINKVGSYFDSKYQSSKCGKMGNSRRFQEIKYAAPGPGKYNDTKVTGFNNSGTYFFSNFRTSKANSFAHSPRRHIADPSSTPGPGSYRRFSDFAM